MKEQGGILPPWNYCMKRLIAPRLIAALVPIALPCTHMIALTYLYSDKPFSVDRKNCSCSCWDTVFKGSYENKVAKYKHIYFSATENTAKIWTVTVMGVIVTYECFKSLIKIFMAGKLRLTMACLFLASLHSHYYTLWSYWNYWNDDFYKQWNHQVFYTLTEIAATSLVLRYMDRRRGLASIPLLVIANIGFFHVLLGGADQFVRDVLMRQGRLHQVIRDVPFMFNDLIHTAIPMYELRRISKGQDQKGGEEGNFWNFLCNRKHVATLVFSSLLLLLAANYFFSLDSQ